MKARIGQEAWKQLVQEGIVNRSAISEDVAESWSRCLDSGVNHRFVEHQVLTENELKNRRRQHARLLQIAIPLMEDLFNLVNGSGFAILLSDTDGYILHSVGDAGFYEDATKVSLIDGANWHENTVGTNAIGTALAVRRPININRYEHFCMPNHILTCSAAPIISPTGEMLAVLDISGNYLHANPHTLGMVVAAARSIENQLLLSTTSDQLVVAYQRVSTTMDALPEGIVAVDEDGLITQINGVAAQWLGIDAAKCIGRTAEEISRVAGMRFIDWKKYRYPMEKVVTTRLVDGAPDATFVVRTIVDNRGSYRGAVATIREVAGRESVPEKPACYTFADILGSSPSLMEAKRLSYLAAGTNSTILLQGETGTGKEMFAQAIHQASSRASGPFVVMNCGAFPESLIESELFGYEEGAFTGAHKGGRIGKIELANHGTLFLDELEEMPPRLQVDLLRVIEDQQVTRLGGKQVTPVDIRIIAATNRNLQKEVESGRFRNDLYYRLNVINIRIPSLADRDQDVLELADYFLTKYCSRRGKVIKGMDPEVVKIISAYSWPGNVREIRNVFERVAVLADGDMIKASDLPDEIRNGVPKSNRNEETAIDRDSIVPLSELERRAIIQAIELCRGNLSEAARKLGVGRNTLYRKMKEYEIEG